MGLLYKLDFPNGKSYIGITSKTAQERFCQHSRNSAVSVVGAAIRKYKKEKVALTILAECESWDNLCHLEIAAIRDFKTKQPSGYNFTDGGDGVPGHKHSATIRLKMADLARRPHFDQRKRVTCTCASCKTIFEVTLSQFNLGRGRYCSKVCYAVSQKRQVSTKCANCATVFHTKPSNLKRGFGKYCSRGCRDAGQMSMQKVSCVGCGVSFLAKPSEILRGKSKYCSKMCHTKSLGTITCRCQICGIEFKKSVSKVADGRGKYCSRACYSIGMRRAA